MRFRDIFVIAAVPVLGALAGQAAWAGPAIDLTSPGLTYDASAFTLGFEFTVTGTQSITALGVFNGGQASLPASASVGLWNTSGTLLTSITIPRGTGATGTTDFTYASITPYTLSPGTDYIIGSYLAAQVSSYNTGQGGVASVNPDVTIVEDQYASSNSLTFPSSTDSYTGGAWLGANFVLGSSVPEPATLALLGAGLFGLGLARRRRG